MVLIRSRPKFKPNLPANRERTKNRPALSDKTAAEKDASVPSPTPEVSNVEPAQKIVDEPEQSLISSPKRVRCDEDQENEPTPKIQKVTQEVAVADTEPLSKPDPPQSPVKRRHTSPQKREIEALKEFAKPFPSMYIKRKAEHIKKFNAGVPERKKMTMFDLIFYNPEDGAKMKSKDAEGDDKSSICSDTVQQRLTEEAIDDIKLSETASTAGDDEPTQMPVPQVKVTASGEIIIDEASTVIETTAQRKAKEDLMNSPLVFENTGQGSNYGSWGKKRKNIDWSEKETLRFFKALSVFGTDFSMMENFFKRRNRKELKLKFKKEEKRNRTAVERCLRDGMQFNASVFESESEDDEDTPKPKPKRSKKAKKSRRSSSTSTRRSKVGSESSEDADAEESDMDASSNASSPIGAKRRDSRHYSTQENPVDDGTAFPPALLAANPDLAAALPGSLVVVGANQADPGTLEVSTDTPDNS